jgi:hypothetical protein
MKFTLLLMMCFLICASFLMPGQNFDEILNKQKELVFFDSCTESWENHWILDGKEAKIENSDSGMNFIAGPELGNDTSHAVLWAKEQFAGNIIIQYEYTRTDSTIRFVNILYFLATGKDTEGYHKDIFTWNDKRVVPRMRTYYNNLNTYHISYAAFGQNNNGKDNDYIRLRRYMPQNNTGLKNTDIEGDHFNTGLFNTGETFLITVIKYNEKVWMNIESKVDKNKKLLCEWDTSEYPDLREGRIGLRHMHTRSARYKNFKVWQICE